VDAAHDEDAVRRRGVAEHDRPDGASVDAVADREHRQKQGEKAHYDGTLEGGREVPLKKL
jgi:hypothetical protein